MTSIWGDNEKPKGLDPVCAKCIEGVARLEEGQSKISRDVEKILKTNEDTFKLFREKADLLKLQIVHQQTTISLLRTMCIGFLMLALPLVAPNQANAIIKMLIPAHP